MQDGMTRKCSSTCKMASHLRLVTDRSFVDTILSGGSGGGGCLLPLSPFLLVPFSCLARCQIEYYLMNIVCTALDQGLSGYMVEAIQPAIHFGLFEAVRYPCLAMLPSG